MAKNQKSYTPELKQQIVDLYHTDQDFKEAGKAIFEYIESWYKQIHSAINYMTPQQKEDEELKKVAQPFNFFCPKD